MNDVNGRAKPTKPYQIIAIVIIAIGGIAAATTLLVVGEDGVTKAAVVLSFVSTTIVTLVSLQAKQTHDLVNSTATELKRVSNDLAFAKGTVAGIAQEAAEPAREGTSHPATTGAE